MDRKKIPTAVATIVRLMARVTGSSLAASITGAAATSTSPSPTDATHPSRSRPRVGSCGNESRTRGRRPRQSISTRIARYSQMKVRIGSR